MSKNDDYEYPDDIDDDGLPVKDGDDILVHSLAGETYHYSPQLKSEQPKIALGVFVEELINLMEEEKFPWIEIVVVKFHGNDGIPIGPMKIYGAEIHGDKFKYAIYVDENGKSETDGY